MKASIKSAREEVVLQQYAIVVSSQAPQLRHSCGSVRSRVRRYSCSSGLSQSSLLYQRLVVVGAVPKAQRRRADKFAAPKLGIAISRALPGLLQLQHPPLTDLLPLLILQSSVQLPYEPSLHLSVCIFSFSKSKLPFCGREGDLHVPAGSCKLKPPQPVLLRNPCAFDLLYRKYQRFEHLQLRNVRCYPQSRIDKLESVPPSR